MTNRTKVLTHFVPGRGYTKADWDAVDSPELTPEELASMRPAREVLPPEFFEALEQRRQGQRGPQKAPTKQLVTMRLDRDLLDRLKTEGPGWQSRVNALLRKAVGL